MTVTPSKHKPYTHQELRDLLRAHGVNPTMQRVEVAGALLAQHGHFSAEDVFTMVNQKKSMVSKATIYNTLGVFAEHGLIRTVIVDPNKIFYDSNIAPHYHIYDMSSGELLDIDQREVQITGLPILPEGLDMEGVDIIVRVRRSSPNAN